MVVALMIAWMGIKLEYNALSELIDTSLDRELVASIQATMQSSPGVAGVHKLRSRSMGGLGYVDAHIEVSPDLTVSEAHYIAHQTEHQVKSSFPQIVDVQIHIDPLDDKIRESVLDKLPGRAKIIDDLNRAWKTIPEHAQVEQIKLHYLDQVIDIDLFMQADMDRPAAPAQVERLREAVAGLGYIGRVNIYYAA